MGKGPLTALVDNLLEELKTGAKQKHSALEECWPEIVGPTIARHTKGRLLAGGTLCVWADDSVLADELGRRHAGTILQKTKERIGEKEVKKIIFRVGEIS